MPTNSKRSRTPSNNGPGQRDFTSDKRHDRASGQARCASKLCDRSADYGPSETKASGLMVTVHIRPHYCPLSARERFPAVVAAGCCVNAQTRPPNLSLFLRPIVLQSKINSSIIVQHRLSMSKLRALFGHTPVLFQMAPKLKQGALLIWLILTRMQQKHNCDARSLRSS